MISKDNKKQLIYLILAILWGYLIFYLSSIPNLASGFSFYYDFILRKIAHIFVFFVLTYLVSKAINSTQKLHLSFVIITVIYYAFIDEIHQANIITRQGNYTDILIDSLGVFLGILLFEKEKNSQKGS